VSSLSVSPASAGAEAVVQIPPQPAALLLARDDEALAGPDQVRVQPGRVDGGGEGAGQFGERPVVLGPAPAPGDLQLADDAPGLDQRDAALGFSRRLARGGEHGAVGRRDGDGVQPQGVARRGQHVGERQLGRDPCSRRACIDRTSACGSSHAP
jgi:hypothetical protein